MISFWLGVIYSVYWLLKAWIDYKGLNDKKQASEDIKCWKLSAGNLFYCFLLECYNAYSE